MAHVSASAAVLTEDRPMAKMPSQWLQRVPNPQTLLSREDGTQSSKSSKNPVNPSAKGLLKLQCQGQILGLAHKNIVSSLDSGRSRTTNSQKLAEVPRRAHIQGSSTFASLNSRLERNQEEEGRSRRGMKHAQPPARETTLHP